MKVLLTCSNGGHLAQLHQLEPWWEEHQRLWFTFDTPDARSVLAGEQVEICHHPTTRNIKNMVKNFGLSWSLISRFQPDVVVSTGAGVAFPAFVVAKLRRIPTVYIEVFDRVDSATMTGRLCHPFSDLFAVQWEEQRAVYPKGELVGRLL